MEAMDWIHVVQERDTSAGSCEYGNEPLGKILGISLVSVDLLRKKIQSPISAKYVRPTASANCTATVLNTRD
jgi:hypothetical protein